MGKPKKIKIVAALVVILLGSLVFKYYNNLNNGLLASGETFKVGDLSVSAYKKVFLSQKKLPMNIKSDAGGIYLVSDTPSPVVSRLTIDGKIIKNRATLRTKYNDSPPQYGSLTGDEMNMWIEPYERFELMIYSDKPFEYQLDGIKLQTCTECMTKEDFKKFLLEEIPGLKESLEAGNELEAARLLLHWSSRVSDLMSGHPANSEQLSFVSQLSAQQIYQDVWLADNLGGLCGLFAIFYDAVLKLFDINSFTVDMGLNDGQVQYFTHVVTIVPQFENSEWKFYLFDPTSDGTFVDENGNFMDIESLLLHFDKESRRMNAGVMDADDCIPRDRILHRSGTITVFKDAQYCVKEGMIAGWEKAARANNSPNAERLAAYQQDPQTSMHLDMLLSRIFSIGNALEPASRQAFIDLLKRYGTIIN